MSVLTATGAGVRHHRRWLLRDLTLTVQPGQTVAIIGPPGSGRTTALLALARRLRLNAGTIQLTGTAELGHVPGVTEPEPVLTVLEHVQERLALLGRPGLRGLLTGAGADAAGVPLHGLDPAMRGRDLSPYQRQVLGVVLARLSRPSMLALDGVDAGLDAAERDDLWRLLGTVTAGGVAVLVTARELEPGRADATVTLDDPRLGEPGRAVVEWSGPESASGTDPTDVLTDLRAGQDLGQAETVELLVTAGRVQEKTDTEGDAPTSKDEAQ
ncbi:ATP-binding cassette domain-containing protein [Actinoplanes sp. NBRC 101535]|uniref:ATP-binding cassette domain-containing protein n=1 Tax=Actinoplanes sp. NBRC 101535 TaxID=3032196 RepID=UPI0024A3B466|nr:ATP-binding cassette domain-containing protein [Actinoplanes sp. NBRC 101535]GLY04828.1 hypothetical protein Acsp01_52070 [Actinoplanes sp. NBRC 101535]